MQAWVEDPAWDFDLGGASLWCAIIQIALSKGVLAVDRRAAFLRGKELPGPFHRGSSLFERAH